MDQKNSTYKNKLIEKLKENPLGAVANIMLKGGIERGSIEDGDKDIIELLRHSLEKMGDSYFSEKRSNAKTEYNRRKKDLLKRLEEEYLSEVSNIDAEEKRIKGRSSALGTGSLKKYVEVSKND